MKKIDVVTGFFCLVLLVSFVMPAFMSYKTSRIAFGIPISAKECFGSWYWALFLIIVFFLIMALIKRDNPRLNLLTGVVAAVSLAVLIWAISANYDNLPFETGGNARMSFGFGFLLMLVAFYGIMVKCSQYVKPYLRTYIVLVACLLTAVFLVWGELDHYSVMQEYIVAKNQFWTNVWDHLRLSLWVLLFAVLTGVPLGYLCNRYKPLDSVVLTGLSITETIPIIALFAVIRIPFSYLRQQSASLQELGFGGYGVAPAFTALYLYALYLVVHNVRAAFSTVDPYLTENAFAMGMNSRQVFFLVRLPLALPVIWSGIRIALISTLVATTLASYVGAGGLGIYIVNGINTLSIDLQLLGVIPIFSLTVLADAVMQFLGKTLTPGKRRRAYDLTAGGLETL